MFLVFMCILFLVLLIRTQISNSNFKFGFQNQNWFSKFKFQKRFLPGESHNRNAPGRRGAAAAWVCWRAVWQKRAKAPAVSRFGSEQKRTRWAEKPSGSECGGLDHAAHDVPIKRAVF
jgi:hypothetical protein